jgi:hypothetical protein
MLDYIIYVAVSFVIFGLVSGFFGARSRKNRPNSNNSNRSFSANEKRIRARYDAILSEFLKMEDKDVPISGTSYRFQINKKPFGSDFSNLKNEVSDHVLSLIKNESEKYNSLFNDYVDAIIANALTGEFGFSESDVIDILEEYLEQIYVLYLNYFVEGAIPHILNSNGNIDENYLVSKLREYNENASSIYRAYFVIHQQNNSGFFGGFSNDNQQTNNAHFAQENELISAYRTLGVSPSDSNDKIKKVYRGLAKKYHPDKNDSKEAKEMMAEINSAYTIIRKNRNF